MASAIKGPYDFWGVTARLTRLQNEAVNVQQGKRNVCFMASVTSIFPTFAVICVGPRRMPIALGAAVCGTCTPFTPVNAGCT